MGSFHDDSAERLKAAQEGNQSTHGLPGDNVPRTPGGTPWYPSDPPTGVTPPTGGPSKGTKPPGWSVVFLHVLQGLLANPSFNAEAGVDKSLSDLAAKLADSIIAHYPAEFGA